MITSQHLINTTLGILSGPGALYELRVQMTCRILALEKKRTSFNSVGYSGLRGRQENEGGGGENDSTSTADLAMVSSTQLGRLLVVVRSIGTRTLE